MDKTIEIVDGKIVETTTNRKETDLGAYITKKKQDIASKEQLINTTFAEINVIIKELSSLVK